jgi:hypothetical protein
MVNGEGEKALIRPAGTMSQAAIGRALGLSPAAMTKLKHQGMPVDSVEAAQAWREARQNVAARKPVPGASPAAVPLVRRPPPADVPAPPPGGEGGGGDGLDYPDEDRDMARTRREIAEANMAEMSEARLRRELIRVQAVQDQIALDYATTREGLLQIPARMGPTLAAVSDPAAIQRMLHTAIHEALQKLAGSADRLPLIEGAFD